MEKIDSKSTECRINIIGAGHVGQTIGRLAHTLTHAQIGTVLCRTQHSSQKAVDFIGSGHVADAYQAIQPADHYWLAVSDDQIKTAAQSLKQNHTLPSGSTVVHFSGLLSAQILKDTLQQDDLHYASLHPVKSFADIPTSVKTFNGTPCGFEGDAQAEKALKPLFKKMGAQWFTVNSHQKTLYHAACVMASNYLVTLTYISQNLLSQAGVEQNMLNAILHPLQTGTLQNLTQLPPHQALTGPLQRNDFNTLQQHLQALAALPATRNLYTLLAEQTLDLCSFPEEIKAQYHQLFQSDVKKN